jgi:signal transduction histidine kinase
MTAAAEPAHEEIIRQVPLFAGLSAEEAENLYRSAKRIHAAPGERIIEEGAVGDSMFIVIAGELEVTKRDGDRDLLLATRKAGDFIGEMALLEQVPRTASVRAVRESDLLSIAPEAFRHLIEKSPAAATTILRTIAGRLRSTEASLIQSDKLAALGTLAAGLAHELNNPAAAIQRSTELLSASFEDWRRRTVELYALDLSAGERTGLDEIEAAIASCEGTRVDDSTARAAENALLERLEALGIKEPWDLAPAMAGYGWTPARLEPVVATFSPNHIAAVLEWLGTALNTQQLVEEVRRSSRAISDIVRSVKSYAYLDRAPIQDVDLAASLDDTLMILNHKIKHGITVVRDFAPDLPRVEAFAGELNQVWTNIIDNAIQAMDGQGTLEIHTRGLGDTVEVRIVDSGPGIPPDAAPHIFEPFFTTKAQGVGTGLGLHIAHNIVVNHHRGRIDFLTEAGRTEFRIVLPLRLVSGTSTFAVS